METFILMHRFGSGGSFMVFLPVLPMDDTADTMRIERHNLRYVQKRSRRKESSYTQTRKKNAQNYNRALNNLDTQGTNLNIAAITIRIIIMPAVWKQQEAANKKKQERINAFAYFCSTSTRCSNRALLAYTCVPMCVCVYV